MSSSFSSIVTGNSEHIYHRSEDQMTTAGLGLLYHLVFVRRNPMKSLFYCYIDCKHHFGLSHTSAQQLFLPYCFEEHCHAFTLLLLGQLKSLLDLCVLIRAFSGQARSSRTYL